jgi:hypothetical protein
MLVSVPHVLLLLFSWSWGISAATPSHEEIVGDFFNKTGTAGGSTSDHTNNWAVLVCASRYWFNYRVRLCPMHLPCGRADTPQHMANALGMCVPTLNLFHDTDTAE